MHEDDNRKNHHLTTPHKATAGGSLATHTSLPPVSGKRSFNARSHSTASPKPQHHTREHHTHTSWRNVGRLPLPLLRRRGHHLHRQRNRRTGEHQQRRHRGQPTRRRYTHHARQIHARHRAPHRRTLIQHQRVRNRPLRRTIRRAGCAQLHLQMIRRNHTPHHHPPITGIGAQDATGGAQPVT